MADAAPPVVSLDALPPEFRGVFGALFGRLDEIEGRLAVKDVTADVLSAQELAVRWNISGGNALQRIARRCAACGLMPLAGTRGWRAVYRLCDVLRAEARAAGDDIGKAFQRR